VKESSPIDEFANLDPSDPALAQFSAIFERFQLPEAGAEVRLIPFCARRSSLVSSQLRAEAEVDLSFPPFSSNRSTPSEEMESPARERSSTRTTRRKRRRMRMRRPRRSARRSRGSLL